MWKSTSKSVCCCLPVLIADLGPWFRGFARGWDLNQPEVLIIQFRILKSACLAVLWIRSDSGFGAKVYTVDELVCGDIRDHLDRFLQESLFEENPKLQSF